jgi:hypothetical protein
MVNFAEAYKTGLLAADLAKKNKREINAVFDELNKQLADATDGEIFVSRQRLLGETSKEDVIRHMFSGRINEPKFYDAIAAENRFVNNSSKELARWRQSRAGYPCEIILGSKSMICEDRQALENALAIMLCDPVVGEILFKLKNLPISEQTSIDNLTNSSGEGPSDISGAEE